MQRFDIVSTRDSLTFGHDSSAHANQGRIARAVTLFAYAAMGWGALVGAVFLASTAY